jgi:uncharacterized protein YndB with AHSA1/START domain
MKRSAISRRAAGLAMFVFAPLKLLSASARSVRNGSSFSYLIYVRATPVRVWSALLDPEMQKRIWLGHFLESKWQAGAPWQMVSLDGRTANSGEVLEIDPPRRLVLTWRNEIYPERTVEGYSRAVIELRAADGMTKVSVTHTMDRPESKLIAAASGSWPLILSNLKSLLEQASPS